MTFDGKIDRGFCLDYWRLSYRRKMIRTLWMIPIVLLIPALPVPEGSGLVAILFRAVGPWGVVALLLLGLAIQAAYNFGMWRKHEANHISVLR